MENPSELSLRQAPTQLKKAINKKILNHIEWIKSQTNKESSLNAFKTLAEVVNPNNQYSKEFDSTAFWNKINTVDNLRNENLLNVFTDLTPFLSNEAK